MRKIIIGLILALTSTTSFAHPIEGCRNEFKSGFVENVVLTSSNVLDKQFKNACFIKLKAEDSAKNDQFYVSSNPSICKYAFSLISTNEKIMFFTQIIPVIKLPYVNITGLSKVDTNSCLMDQIEEVAKNIFI